MQSVAFSPDGKSIATGGVWGRIRIWDSDSGAELIAIRRHMITINSIAFSADGRYMVSACADETIKVWNVTSGRELMTLRGHGNHVNSAAFSPDGTRIISSSDDETIKIWDANSGAGVMTLHGHEGGVGSVSFSMDGKRIVSGGYDNTIRIWDIANPEEVASLMQKLGKPRDSLTGKMIAWWKLDETEGNNAADSSGNNLNGKLIGDPQWQFGQVGGALMFDGDGDYVDCGNDSAFNITGSITVAAWIKVNKFDKVWQAICTKGDGAWILHRNADTDNIKFNIFDWGSPDVVGFVNVNDGQWHHVVGAYDGAKIYLYVNGILDSSTPVSTWDEMIINEEPVCIGQNSKYPERSWNGFIDDVRIYSYALSAEEIKDLYEGKETP